MKNKFTIFIVGALVIAGILAGLSLWLYESDGTAQLDLSRPSYQEAREAKKREIEAEKRDAKAAEFSGEGEINDSVLSEFEKIYKAKIGEIKADEFDQKPLSDEQLEIAK